MQRQEEERIATACRCGGLGQSEAEVKAAAERRKPSRKPMRRPAPGRAGGGWESAKGKRDAARPKPNARKAAADLRAQLLDQFSRVLATRDTHRGLVVNMGDVLFDTGKFNLRTEAREALAKLSGIVMAHPGLNLEIEGHTDSTGSDELNQKLSEERAGAVRSYLVQQGLPDSSVTSQGLGKSMPVADNATSAGRQHNRRVEIIVSGEVIGEKIGR
jgi:outer membrane protein OmpA-like peptidoglycan-associated protein